jgi:hypothetical protein
MIATKLIQLERQRIELIEAIDYLEGKLNSPPAPYTTQDILKILNNSRGTLRKLEYLIDGLHRKHK